MIQPSKILAALSGYQFVLGQFLIPPAIYLLLVISKKSYEQIKLHVLILLSQVCIIAIHFTLADVFLNRYFLFFLITPHFFIFAKYLFEQHSDIKPFFRALSIFNTATLILSIISILHSKKYGIGLDAIISIYDTSIVTREDTLIRWRLLEAMNYSRSLFGTDGLTLEGVTLTVYPLILVSFLFLKKEFLKDKFTLIGLFSSFILIFLKSSRGEMVYILLLAGYPIAEIIFSKFKWASILIIGLGFIQLGLGNKALNGRHILNDFFLNNISLFGKGVGFSSEKILELTRSNYSSFHNIHFELITNFGIVIYAGFILFTAYYVLNGSYNRSKHLLLCLFFFLLTTNFEFFDIYFCVPAALAVALMPKPEKSPSFEHATKTINKGREFLGFRHL